MAIVACILAAAPQALTARDPWIERLPVSEARADEAWPAPIVPPWCDPYQPPQQTPASFAGFFDPNVDLAKPDQSPTPEGQSPGPAFPNLELQDETPVESGPQLPPGAKQGVLQRVILQGSWLPGGSGDGFGMADFDARVSLGFPFPTVATPLVVTPGYAVHYFDGPQNAEAPAAAYDGYVDVMWKLPFWECWNVDLAITPGWYSDYQQGSSEALRIGGRALFSYTMSPQHRFMFGAVYLDREDVNVLPVAGWIWTPNDDVRLELVMPRPKFSRRFSCRGDCADWWYVGGEFGGGSWAIATSGGEDVMNYSDLRGVVGVETKRNGTQIAWVEAGYVFNRRLSYNSGAPDFEPDGTFLLRAGVGY